MSYSEWLEERAKDVEELDFNQFNSLASCNRLVKQTLYDRTARGSSVIPQL